MKSCRYAVSSFIPLGTSPFITSRHGNVIVVVIDAVLVIDVVVIFDVVDVDVAVVVVDVIMKERKEIMRGRTKLPYQKPGVLTKVLQPQPLLNASPFKDDS